MASAAAPPPSFGDRVAALCLEHYLQDVPKRGKPQGKETTLFAAIVMERCGTLTVVAFGTGTKCLGAAQMVESGALVNDCHAEVMARRAFRVWLHHQLQHYAAGRPSVFVAQSDGRLGLTAEEPPTFHFFSSQAPCGDASIFEYSKADARQPGVEVGAVGTAEPQDDAELLEPPAKRPRLNASEAQGSAGGSTVPESMCRPAMVLPNQPNPSRDRDLHRTGAKSVGVADPMEDGLQFHTVGVVRTKPGRGPPTQSMSCSDKLALWSACGLQGALLGLLVTPVYLSSVTVAEDFSHAAVQRALHHRLAALSPEALPPTYRLTPPALHACTVRFPFPRHTVVGAAGGCPRRPLADVEDASVSPGESEPPAETSRGATVTCGYAVCFSKGVLDEVLIAHRGSRQGVSAKQLKAGRGTSPVSPAGCLAALQLTCEVLCRSTDPAVAARAGSVRGQLAVVTYGELKADAAEYQRAKAAVLALPTFRDWVVKAPSYRQFCAAQAPPALQPTSFTAVA